MTLPSTNELISFAKAQLHDVFGDAIPPCYLAGGAYKSLLHGKTVNDLDIFAQNQEEREQLIRFLRAHYLEISPSPGAERFFKDGLRIEIPFRVLEMERMLDRFDIGLSCVGVMVAPRYSHCIVHRSFYASIAQKKIHILRCHPHLVLATLVRIRRYAHELSYQLEDSTEEELWSLHERESKSIREEQMTSLLFHYGENTWGVLEDAKRRFMG